jgi:hypothetical protein
VIKKIVIGEIAEIIAAVFVVGKILLEIKIEAPARLSEVQHVTITTLGFPPR